jgi:hypothetical protein
VIAGYPNQLDYSGFFHTLDKRTRASADLLHARSTFGDPRGASARQAHGLLVAWRLAQGELPARPIRFLVFLDFPVRLCVWAGDGHDLMEHLLPALQSSILFSSPPACTTTGGSATFFEIKSRDVCASSLDQVCSPHLMVPSCSRICDM